MRNLTKKFIEGEQAWPNPEIDYVSLILNSSILAKIDLNKDSKYGASKFQFHTPFLFKVEETWTLRLKLTPSPICRQEADFYENITDESVNENTDLWGMSLSCPEKH